MPSPVGEPTLKLSELKCIGAVPKWYPRSGTCARRKGGVERRGEKLAEEYRKPLATLDTRYHGTPAGQVGPLVRRLESYGQLQALVMGSFQEGSKDLHSLLGILADSQLKAKGLARKKERSDQERSVILAGMRRQLSMAASKAYSACLLDRVARVGEEHRQAAERRSWHKMEVEKMEEERKAYWHAFVRGITARRGQFLH